MEEARWNNSGGGARRRGGFPFHVEIAGISIPEITRSRAFRFMTDLEADQTVNGCVGRLISGSRPLFSRQVRDKSNNRKERRVFPPILRRSNPFLPSIVVNSI